MKKNTSKLIEPLLAEDLEVFRARLLRAMWREIYLAFEKREKEEGLTKSDIAERLDVHKSVISRRLNGTGNITIEILSDMARVLACKPEIKITPYEDIVSDNHDASYDCLAKTYSEESSRVRKNVRFFNLGTKQSETYKIAGKQYA